MTAPLTLLSRHACFGGNMEFVSHTSAATGGTMRFSVYLPPQAADGPVPVLYYLAGLTCTEETFMIKGGAQRLAAKHGLMLVAPDTSPRGAGIAGEDDSWDFGTGAGFYIDATEEPWSGHYRMERYVAKELPALVQANFPADPERQGIFGHSMGGHGALTLAFKYPKKYLSVSAFAPIANPVNCPWGHKAFSGYLGPDRERWAAHDATLLVATAPTRPTILVDQGTADQFLPNQLNPQAFEAACKAAGQPLVLRMQQGYDHGYYFIATFMADHIAHHAEQLKA